MTIEASPSTLEAENTPTRTVRFARPGQPPFLGHELYVHALRAPMGNSVWVQLQDEANYGMCRARVVLAAIASGWWRRPEEVPGQWNIYVFAQDSSTATPQMEPVEAAGLIRVYMVHSPFRILIDATSPCPERADATVQVV